MLLKSLAHRLSETQKVIKMVDPARGRRTHATVPQPPRKPRPRSAG